MKAPTNANFGCTQSLAVSCVGYVNAATGMPARAVQFGQKLVNGRLSRPASSCHGRDDDADRT